VNIRRAAGENLSRRCAVDELGDAGREHSFAAARRARDEVGMGEATAGLRSAQIIERNFCRESHRSGMPAAGRRNHLRELTKPRRNHTPDFCFNLLD